jgi:hypothetical protein
MPGFTTHTYICYQALKRGLKLSDSYRPFANIAASHEAALRHAKANEPKRLFGDEAGVLAGCAYMGACGPDLFYIEYDTEGEFVADLLHYNRTGPFIVRWLADLRLRAASLRMGLGGVYERQLAYCLGHISHIAADITIHPYVNSIVGAYPENAVCFKNARGLLPKLQWKFHNILEHYQDAYILHRRFIAQEGLGPDENCVNLGAPAGVWLREQGRSEWLGFVARTRDFYRYDTTLDIEKYKYDFFANENTFVNVSGYYSDIIPSEEMMDRVPRLTQGAKSNDEGLFDQYVESAIALTLQMWGEVRSFMDVPRGITPTFPDQKHRLDSKELKAFPMLGQHWNLDCGLAPQVIDQARSEQLDQAPRRSVSVGGAIGLMTPAGSSRHDVLWPSPGSSAPDEMLPPRGGIYRGTI